ncbi:hypothetical protein BDW72DRAFT_196230 [Aspergillus terricola var. indicus]
MTIVVNPYIPLASTEHREKYLSLVRDVARETQDNEPDCLAYCWTRPISTPENATDGPVFVQGIEVYKTLDALSVVHRSSAPYLQMRKIVSSTALITFPKGGVPIYEPAGTGFLTKRGAVESVSPANIFVFMQYTVKGCENLAFFLAQEKILCSELKATDAIQALWCFVPEQAGREVSVTIFIRLLDASYYDELEASILSFETKALASDSISKTSSWKGEGFGFFRQDIDDSNT